LMITCKSGITIRTSIAEIREAGRATQGVKLIRLDESDEIAAISKIEEQVEEEVTKEDIQEAVEAIADHTEALLNETPGTGETSADQTEEESSDNVDNNLDNQ
jgi:DNA gyrase subunit A